LTTGPCHRANRDLAYESGRFFDRHDDRLPWENSAFD